MLIVGTDAMTVVGTAAVPHGTRHAVDQDGRVLCRNSRPRYVWPALSWDDRGSEDGTCRLCGRVRSARESLSHVASYPNQSPVPSQALVPWQPSTSLFEPRDQ